MSKKPHVPETRSVKPNREQRRHPEKLDPEKQPTNDEPPARLQDNLMKAGSADEISVRAKTTGHGKKTADKWNQ